MSYNLNYTDPNVPGREIITVTDQTINDQDTSLAFVGKNVPGYAKYIGENFLHLLENFAKNSPPDNPVIGQLWYDTGSQFSPPRPQLKVWDSTQWIEAGNVKKGNTRPRAENSIIGDLWTDVSAQQLYMFSGADWVLVGPEFNQVIKSGFKVEVLINKDNNLEVPVIVSYINNDPIVIISRDNFVPKTTVDGFSQIRQGINLSSKDFDFNGRIDNKFWGTSEKSESLIVGNSIVPASNFLRSDTTSTTNFTLNVRSSGGLFVGPSLEASLSAGTDGATLTNRTPNSVIRLRTTSAATTLNPSGTPRDVITITGEDRVGINKQAPAEALDIVGNIQLTGNIKCLSSLDVNGNIGSFVTNGGLGITKSLQVGNNITTLGSINVGPQNFAPSEFDAVIPNTDSKFNIGTPTNRFKNIFARSVYGDEFIGTFVGTVAGNVSGAAGRLVNNSAFSIIGDVSSNTVIFNGSTQAISDKQIVNVSRNSLGIVTATTVSNHDYLDGSIVSVEIDTTNTLLKSFETRGSAITVTGNNTFTYDQSKLNLESISSNVTGIAKVLPGGAFVSSINESFINNKISLNDSQDSDTFLVYRRDAVPPLRKITKEVLFGNIGSVPIGVIMPYAGSVPPLGYLLCDGSEQRILSYSKLFNVIGYQYRPQSQLLGFQTFALPDLRGRFPLGRENMDNANTINIETTATNVSRIAAGAGATSVTFSVSSALIVNGPFQIGRTLEGTGLQGSTPQITAIQLLPGNVVRLIVSCQPQPEQVLAATALTVKSIGIIDAGGGNPPTPRVPSATTIGNVGGNSSVVLTTANLPDHEHNMKGSAGTQFYAINDRNNVPSDTGAFRDQGPSDTNDAQYLPSSGGVMSNVLGQPFGITNPYQTINYIIYTGEAF